MPTPQEAIDALERAIYSPAEEVEARTDGSVRVRNRSMDDLLRAHGFATGQAAAAAGTAAPRRLMRPSVGKGIA